jgi:hypothetical protein
MITFMTESASYRMRTQPLADPMSAVGAQPAGALRSLQFGRVPTLILIELHRWWEEKQKREPFEAPRQAGLGRWRRKENSGLQLLQLIIGSLRRQL